MSVTSILLHADCSPGFVSRLAVAADLAERHGAKLKTVYDSPSSAPYIYADVPDEVHRLAAIRERVERDEIEARTAFELAMKGRKIESEWEVLPGSLAEGMREHVGYADVVIVGQNEDLPGGSSGLHTAETVLLESGRPVIVVPYVGVQSRTGDRIAVAWNGGPSAARAVHGAMPFLQAASQVDIVVFDADRDNASAALVAGERMCAHLGDHGVFATPHSLVGSAINVGEQLLSRAADWSSDLIVMGAYEHSRFRERLLGGTTRSVLHHMTVPVLMAH